MTRWIILGAGGMLGQEFVNLKSSHEVIGLTRNECDVASFSELIDKLHDADVVVNCAAWTAVDEAETNEEGAFKINAIGANNVARACNKLGTKLVHISTDYVFPGNSNKPYDEDSATGPSTAYGRTKLAGENAVLAANGEHSYIVRTAWLYGGYGPNFVKTMIALEKKNDFISVVSDQFGQPTWTVDIVNKIVELVESNSKTGIYHGTSSGFVSWHGFAQKIFSLIGADPSRVKPISSDEFSRPAQRPKYSVLGHRRWSEAGISPIRQWEEAITEAFQVGAF